MSAPVLVTGGSGFVGVHTILALLNAGHSVRTTVRNLAREAEVREMLKRGGVDAGDRLTFAAADLEKDDGWDAAVAGCEFVHHVASPFPAENPKHEDELIIPAREGALRVLRAAKSAGVKRVILTSSFAAIGYGHNPPPARFDETIWSDTTQPMTAYAKSKTLAERAAWDYVKENPSLELSVVNPVAIFGPVLGADMSTSIGLVKRVIVGMPGCPKLWFGIVDVRDVADMHLRCQTVPEARGERFLCLGGDFLPVSEIARLLKEGIGPERGKNIKTRELPNFAVRLAALFDKGLGPTLPELGKKKAGTNEKAKRILGWNPRSNQEAVVSTAESLFQLGIVG